MLTYALIGLGGAAGSILRAWIGSVMMSLIGTEFPWGTILINVIGSFVIGFFGTLTATDGRFAGSPDLRAFVMVGICGGFTTFSSFSLQTLDLLQEGRPSAAIGNIALSVLLCLGGVTAGASAALLIRTAGPVATQAALPDELGSRMMVALHRPEAVRPMLEMAARLMTPPMTPPMTPRATRQNSRILVLAIDGPILAERLVAEEATTGERREELSRRRRDWVGSMRPGLERWVAAERADGVEARWIAVAGDGTRAILEHGRRAHLLLLEHRLDDRASLDRIRAALVRAARPILLVPPGARGEIGRIVAIAWRDDVQAAQAIRAAMPILSRAERIIVLHVGAAAFAVGLPDLLKTLPAELRTIPASGEDVGAQLLGLARDADADLLMMGTYGRGPLVDALFDGITECILRSAHLPVLMQPGAA